MMRLAQSTSFFLKCSLGIELFVLIFLLDMGPESGCHHRHDLQDFFVDEVDGRCVLFCIFVLQLVGKVDLVVSLELLIKIINYSAR